MEHQDGEFERVSISPGDAANRHLHARGGWIGGVQHAEELHPFAQSQARSAAASTGRTSEDGSARRQHQGTNVV